MQGFITILKQQNKCIITADEYIVLSEEKYIIKQKMKWKSLDIMKQS